MNRESILFNLGDALDALNQLLDSIKSDDNLTKNDFRIQMEHVYHHLNFAWNTRNTTDADLSPLLMDRFYQWRQFPKDIDLSSSDDE